MRILALEQAVLDSPAFAAETPSLTSDEALVGFLTTLAGASRCLRLSSLGQSQQGRDLPLIYLTREGLDDPLAIARLGRPVIWLIGQQHGNEPAGGEAMLALASALAAGELAPLLVQDQRRDRAARQCRRRGGRQARAGLGRRRATATICC